jgi:hypothetical protein
VAAMDRQAKQFLEGFQKAAQLAQHLADNRSPQSDPMEYLEDVADLHGHSDDLVRRGLAVGCLCAVGKG